MNEDAIVWNRTAERNGIAARTVFASMAGVVLLGFGMFSDAAAMDPSTCMEMVERNYDTCTARCEYEVEKANRQSQYTGLGPINNFMNDLNDLMTQRALAEGALTQSQVDYYKGLEQISKKSFDAIAVGMCHDTCREEKYEMEEMCW